MIEPVSQWIECYSLSSFLRRSMLRGHRKCIVARNASASPALGRPIVQKLILELNNELVEEAWAGLARIVAKAALSLPTTISQDAFSTVALVIRHIVVDVLTSSSAEIVVSGLSLAWILLQQLLSQLTLISRAWWAASNAFEERVEVLFKLLSKWLLSGDLKFMSTRSMIAFSLSFFKSAHSWRVVVAVRRLSCHSIAAKVALELRWLRTFASRLPLSLVVWVLIHQAFPSSSHNEVLFLALSCWSLSNLIKWDE